MPIPFVLADYNDIDGALATVKAHAGSPLDMPRWRPETRRRSCRRAGYCLGRRDTRERHQEILQALRLGQVEQASVELHGEVESAAAFLLSQMSFADDLPSRRLLDPVQGRRFDVRPNRGFGMYQRPMEVVWGSDPTRAAAMAQQRQDIGDQ